ncbi:MAG TPA: PEGA domain-containing protein [Polyangiaceae bacterium]|nr:PEGA domain-containing protein [Polyangiaceae bacterium]
MLAVLGAAGGARAQASDSVRTEAREHFDRGLRLFNQQDNEGALAEFQRAYELVPHPMVLYNIGLVLSAAGRSVQAVDTFDKLLANPAGLDAGRLGRAKDERARQAALIGEVTVTSPVEGAIVELDGFQVGKTPLAAPLRIGSGTHVLAMSAPGYAPMQKQITVVGLAKDTVAFELQPSDTQPAHLTLRTMLNDCDVLVDDHAVGKTPLAASLAIPAGNHVIEVRRPGYVSAKQNVSLGAGSSGELGLEPALDPSALDREGGFLALAISEKESTTFVDGQPRGVYTTPLHLPRGVHWLRVEHAGFFPFERKVDVPQGSSKTVSVDMIPTPEARSAYRSRTVSQRTWGYIATGVGAALTAGGITYLVINKNQQSDKKAAFERQVARFNPGGDCDQSGEPAADCAVAYKLALSDLSDATANEKYGWIAGGVGVAALGLGIVVLLVNDDPNRYEPKADSDVFGSLHVLPSILPDGHGAALFLSGTLR